MYKRFAPWMLIGLISYFILSLGPVENLISLIGMEDMSLFKALFSMAAISFAAAREKK